MKNKIDLSKIGLVALGAILSLAMSMVEDKKQEKAIKAEVSRQLSEKSEEGE